MDPKKPPQLGGAAVRPFSYAKLRCESQACVVLSVRIFLGHSSLAGSLQIGACYTKVDAPDNNDMKKSFNHHHQHRGPHLRSVSWQRQPRNTATNATPAHATVIDGC
jgi:hypothetical protein